MNFETKIAPQYFDSSHHEIDVSRIPEIVHFVIKTLKSFGYEAFLVGGCVRDLILKGHPNDFDVVTDAKPRDILKIFGRKSRAIGRRFRLVHVKDDGEIIEVSTFRKSPKFSRTKRHKRQLLRGDNEFGSISEDVFRRDYTINALYFDVEQKIVIDYVGGFNDIMKKKLCCIGAPSKRFEEDPMRILRAIRFRVALDLTTKDLTLHELTQHGDLLDKLPAARVFYELEKLFLRGFAFETFNELVDLKLIHFLFPTLDKTKTKLENYNCSLNIINIALKTTDRRVAMGHSATLAFLCAVILWNALKAETKKLRCEIVNESKIFDLATESIISKQVKITAIPRRVSNTIREIWRLQFIFEKPNKKNAYRLLGNDRLRAGYNFFVLRSKNEESLEGAVNWWRKFFNGALKDNKLPFPNSETYKL